MKDLKVKFYEFGQFRLDLKKRQLLYEDKVIPLAKKSYSILLFLIENSERVVSKKELLEQFWEESYVEESNLVQHIYRIRKILKNGGSEDKYIETLSKSGYRFIADVKKTLEDLEVPGNEKQEFLTRKPHLSESDSGKLNSLKNTKLEVDRDPTLITAPIKRRKFTKSLTAIGILVAIILVASYVFFLKPQNVADSNIKSMAILPFQQIGQEKDGKVSLGIADTLISQLSNQKKISITPTSTIIKLTGKESENPIDLGKKLGVDAVLAGTIQKENGTARVNVQLIGIEDKKTLWSSKFDSSFSDVFSLQDEVSRQIAQKLSLDLENNGEALLKAKSTKNIEAYKEYSKGLFYWSKRTPEGLAQAIKHFQNAIDKDAQFVKAYALLADTYSLVGYNKYDLMSEKDTMEKAQTFANKALELDANSSEALTTLALVNTQKKNFQAAKSQLNKAISLKPNNITAYLRLAWLSALEGNLEQAINEMKSAHKIEPHSELINKTLASYLILARKPEEAFALSQRIMEIFPPSNEISIFLAEIYEQKQEYGKSIQELNSLLEKDSENCVASLVLSRIYSKTSKVDKAREVLNGILKIEACQGYNYAIASIFANLKDEDKTISFLKKDSVNLLHLLYLKNDYNLDSIRRSSKFEDYVKQVESKL